MGKEHEMYVRSHSNDVFDEDSMGQIVLVNSINEQEYRFDMWGKSDLDFENGVVQIKEEGLNDLIWLSGVVENLDFKKTKEVQEKLDDALFQSQLADLLRGDSHEKIEEQLIEYNANGKEFNQKIPFENQAMDIKTLLIDEEITRMAVAAIKNELTKKDIVDFGELAKQTGSSEIHVGRLDYFKDPFEKALENSVIEPNEKASVKFAYDAIQLEAPEIVKEQEIVQSKQQKRVKMQQFELER